MLSDETEDRPSHHGPDDSAPEGALGARPPLGAPADERNPKGVDPVTEQAQYGGEEG